MWGMGMSLRNLLPVVFLVVLGVVAVASLPFSGEPPADFAFINGSEPKSLDPHLVTGQPEGRLVSAMFERLVRWDPATGAEYSSQLFAVKGAEAFATGKASDFEGTVGMRAVDARTLEVELSAPTRGTRWWPNSAFHRPPR